MMVALGAALMVRSVMSSSTPQSVSIDNGALAESSRSEVQDLIQLRWLRRIRWAALVSLAVIFFGANYFLELKLPKIAIVGILLLGALSNFALRLLKSPSHTAYKLASGSAIIVDVLLLSGLLYLCGGYTNPFSMMFLAYVTLAAVVLDSRWTWIVFSVSLACFFGLFFLHIPLPQLGMHHHHTGHEGFSLHLHGMLVAFVLIGGIVAAFVTRMNREMQEKAAQIAALQRAEEDQKRLMSLATLTAGAAHELATPIATLLLISEDLSSALSGDPRWAEDVQTMKHELNRCSEILHRMRSGGTELNGEPPRHFALAEVAHELRGAFSKIDSARVVFSGCINEELTVWSLKDALIGSLKALIKNGLQASPPESEVVCHAALSQDEILFTVRDSGIGMSDAVKARAGEPFFTCKELGQGMGLGLYLTKLFALQVGGRVDISSHLGVGTEVLLRIPKLMRV
jgi:two-component system sensor histidine kinase RegB